MPTVQSHYQGNLRTHNKHVSSGNTLLTDAPTDNQGKGEAFSPTDLVSAALGSCMMTIMGIWATKNQVSLEGTTWETTKKMTSQPRKIASIEITFHFPSGLQLSQETRAQLEKVAKSCPVALSLHPEVKQVVHFDYDA
ncbi:MAG: OsmC family protein [Thermonemataceae bacterium]